MKKPGIAGLFHGSHMLVSRAFRRGASAGKQRQLFNRYESLFMAALRFRLSGL